MAWKSAILSNGEDKPVQGICLEVWASHGNQLSDGCLDFVKSGRWVADAWLRFLREHALTETFHCLAVLFFLWLRKPAGGELHLKITDPHSLGVKAAVLLVSQGNEYRCANTT